MKLSAKGCGLQGFFSFRALTAASLKIVVSPVRFWPSPSAEAVAQRALCRRRGGLVTRAWTPTLRKGSLRLDDERERPGIDGQAARRRDFARRRLHGCLVTTLSVDPSSHQNLITLRQWRDFGHLDGVVR